MKQGDKVRVRSGENAGRVGTIQALRNEGGHVRCLVQFPMTEDAIRPLGLGPATVVAMWYDEAELELLS
jgi:hypothetical protein